MKIVLTILTSSLCLLLGFAVILSGIHGKDLLGMLSNSGHDIEKVSAELHNHTDKSHAKALVKAIHDASWQIDSSSTKLLQKKLASTHLRRFTKTQRIRKFIRFFGLGYIMWVVIKNPQIR